MCAALVVAGEVRAHAGPVEPQRLYSRPDGGAQARLLTTSFGLVVTSNGADWDVLCSEGIGYDETKEPVALETGSAIFVGSLLGLFVSRDDGCSWSAISDFDARGVADLQAALSSGGPLYATTGRFGADNGVFRSVDDGQSFTKVAGKADTFFTALRFAPSLPTRAYVSTWYYTPLAASVFRSDDGGATFIEQATTLPWATAFTIIAVSPADESQVYASVFDGLDYVLVRSTDSAASFAEVARDTKPFRSVTFSADAQTVWAAANRLFESADGGATFQKRQAPKRGWCSERFGSEVTACASPMLDGFALGTVEPDGGVTPTLSFSEVRGLQACPAGTSMRDVCEPLWPALALALGVPGADGGVPDGGEAPVDAGEVQDGGATDAGVTERPPPEGCGCGAGGGAGGAWLVLGVMALTALRRRRLLAVAAVVALVSCSGPPVDPPSEDAGTQVDAGSPLDPCEPNPCTAPHQSVCSAQDGAALCACDPGFEPALVGCEEKPPVDCDTQHVDGDEFEPDECPALARDIGASGAQQELHSLMPAGDADWFVVEASSSRVFQLRIGSVTGTTVRVDAWSGEPLARVGRVHASTAEGLDVAFKAPSSGPLFLRLRAADDSATGTYSVSVGDLGFDDYADSPADAQPFPSGATQFGAMQFNDDADVFALPLTAGHAWRMRGATTGGELRFEVIDASGAVRRSILASTFDFVARGDAGSSLFGRFTDPEGARGKGWELEVVDLGPDDAGDDLIDAQTISVPASGAGTFERAADVDVFTFAAQATHIHVFTCTRTSAPHCLAVARDADGVVIAADEDGDDAELRFEAASTGTVTVHVQSAPGEVGSYSYGLVDLGPDDHGDSPATATAMGMPPIMGQLTGSGRIETVNDLDYLSFTADVDHIYRFTCTRAGVPSCNVRILNANGVVVGQDLNGGDGLAYAEFIGGGQFYVELGAGGPGLGDYTWVIDDLFHDDHGDDVFASTLMSANGAFVSGEIQLPGDDDFYRFAADAGRIYRVSCQRVSLGDCALRLFDAGENVLRSDVDGQDATLYFEAPASGELFLGVEGGPGQVGTFHVKVDDLGFDDCADTASGAKPLALGVATSGAFEYPADVDYWQVTAAAATTYSVTGSGAPLVATVYAPDATTVLSSGGVPVAFTTAAAGSYYVKLEALSGSMTGSYSVEVAP